MCITDDDREAILHAVGTFRLGAPIMTDDIRLACSVDGHPIKHVNGTELVHAMLLRCDDMGRSYARTVYGRRW